MFPIRMSGVRDVLCVSVIERLGRGWQPAAEIRPDQNILPLFTKFPILTLGFSEITANIGRQPPPRIAPGAGCVADAGSGRTPQLADNKMKDRVWTLTLTVLGIPNESYPAERMRRRSDTASVRRATLVVRMGDVHMGLRQSLIDSVTRLAGRDVTDIASVVDQILAGLLNHQTPWRDRNNWTLSRGPVESFEDPYDRRSTTLTLVDAPVSLNLSHRLQSEAPAPSLVQTSPRICMS